MVSTKISLRMVEDVVRIHQVVNSVPLKVNLNLENVLSVLKLWVNRNAMFYESFIEKK